MSVSSFMKFNFWQIIKIDLKFEILKKSGCLALQIFNWFLKIWSLNYHLVEKLFSKPSERTIFDVTNSRNVVIICWIKPNYFNFTILPASLRFLVKKLIRMKWSFQWYQNFCVLKGKNYYDVMIMWPLAIRKKVSGHLRYFKQFRITIRWKDKH